MKVPEDSHATASLRLVASNPFFVPCHYEQELQTRPDGQVPYFVSFATVYWIGVFTREVYFEVLAKSVKYCRQNKGLELYAYCFMPNHVHFIFRSVNDDPSGILSDFKKHTSKKIIEAIETNPQEAEKDGYFGCSKEPAGKKAMCPNINFGNIIIILLNCRVRKSLNKSWTISMAIL